LIVRFLLPARREFEDAVRAYNSERNGLGNHFRDVVRETIERIKSFPDAWHPLGGTIRRCRTKRFPYAIVYEQSVDELLILAVAHIRREPVYWQGRRR
jgi:hypothetical protein